MCSTGDEPAGEERRGEGEDGAELVGGPFSANAELNMGEGPGLSLSWRKAKLRRCSSSTDTSEPGLERTRAWKMFASAGATGADGAFCEPKSCVAENSPCPLRDFVAARTSHDARAFPADKLLTTLAELAG